MGTDRPTNDRIKLSEQDIEEAKESLRARKGTLQLEEPENKGQFYRKMKRNFDNDQFTFM